jgi:hypothetical protein
MSIVIDYTKGFFEASPSGETVGDISDGTLDLTSGNYFEFTPSANTTFTFSNPPASGTACGFTLAVTGANVTSGYDIANASFDNVTSSNLPHNAGPWQFGNNGSSIIAYDHAGFTSLKKYTLSTAYDITTLNTTASQTFDPDSFSALAGVGDTILSMKGFQFNSTGTKLGVLCYHAGYFIAVFELSTGWDFSTISLHSQSPNNNTLSGGQVGGFLWNDAGTKFFNTTPTDYIREYTASTAFDATTLSFTRQVLLTSVSTFPNDILSTPDGKTFFTADEIDQNMDAHTLTTGFDLSSVTVGSASANFSSQANYNLRRRFNADGTKLFTLASSDKKFRRYSTTGSPALATIAYPSSVKWAGGTAPTAPANGETDVYSFFTTDGGTTYYGFQAGDAMS